jgi:NADH dehydrogenase
MAGQIAELARDVVHAEFRSVDTRASRVLLIEAADRVLAGFPDSLSRKAARSLERLGVTPLVDHTVVDVAAGSVAIRGPDGEIAETPARTAIWAAGVTASELAARLAEAAGAEVDRAGRVIVEPDLSLPGHPEVLALGDMVQLRAADGTIMSLPGLAPVALQQGTYAARAVRQRLGGETVKPFHYVDKGNLATIGRSKAVADVKGLHLSGFTAWVTWLVVLLFFLIGFQNRVLVLIRWTVSFLTHGRGARLIVRPPEPPAEPDRRM